MQQQDNGGMRPSYPPVMPVVSEVPQVVADEEGKKKKRGFFFKKKKKTKVSSRCWSIGWRSLSAKAKIGSSLTTQRFLLFNCS